MQRRGGGADPGSSVGSGTGDPTGSGGTGPPRRGLVRELPRRSSRYGSHPGRGPGVRKAEGEERRRGTSGKPSGEGFRNGERPVKVAAGVLRCQRPARGIAQQVAGGGGCSRCETLRRLVTATPKRCSASSVGLRLPGQEHRVAHGVGSIDGWGSVGQGGGAWGGGPHQPPNPTQNWSLAPNHAPGQRRSVFPCRSRGSRRHGVQQRVSGGLVEGPGEPSPPMEWLRGWLPGEVHVSGPVSRGRRGHEKSAGSCRRLFLWGLRLLGLSPRASRSPGGGSLRASPFSGPAHALGQLRGPVAWATRRRGDTSGRGARRR